MQARMVLFLCVGLIAGFSPTKVVAADAATEQARRHYLRGNQLFDVGHWDEAADEYERAYAIRSDPSLLYNMAQAYRRKGDAKRALDLYKNYLMKAPKSPQRAEVEERIRALQKQVDDAEAANKASGPAPAPAASGFAPPTGPVAPTASAPPMMAPVQPVSPGYQPGPAAPVYSPNGSPAADSWPGYPATGVPPAPQGNPPPASGGWTANPAPAYVQTPAAPAEGPKPGRGLRIGGIVCGSLGVAAVGAGVVFSVLTKSYSDSVQSGAVFNPNFDERGKLYQTLQWVGYGAGAGLIAAGALLYTLGVTTGSKAKVALVPSVLPGGAALSAGGTF